jgi:hypothetical protein
MLDRLQLGSLASRVLFSRMAADRSLRPFKSRCF